MRKLIKVYLSPYVIKITWELLVKLASTLGELALPVILSYVIDMVIPEKNVDRILLWGLAMAGCGAFSCATHIVTNRISADVSGRVAERIRNDLFEKISSLSEERAEAYTAPSLVSRVTGDSYILYDTMVYLQRTGVRAPIILAGSSVFMFLMDPVLAALVLFAAPLTIWAAWKAAARCVSLYQSVQEKNDRVCGKVMEAVTGLRMIKAFSKEEEESERFRRINEDAAEQEQRAGMAMAVVAPILNVCLQFCIIFLLLAGSLRVYAGKLLPGKMIAFLTYVSLILTALLNVSKVLMLFSKASACGQRIGEVLSEPDRTASGVRRLEERKCPVEEKHPEEENCPKEEKDPEKKRYPEEEKDPGKKEYPEEEKESACFLEFDQVSFSYPFRQSKEKAGGYDVEDISFRLKEGEWLGIIGGTGAGKTTVLKLMMGYFRPGRGEIRIRGRSVQDMDLDEVRSLFAPVFQQDYIQSGTLADNIRFGRDILPERMERAARDAQAAEYIADRPEGFLSRAESGGRNLSGGQKQRLLIARALAGDAPVLVFDDSFSALDYRTMRRLWDALRREHRGRTAVVVSQRVGFMTDMDRILVLEAGHMAGYGTHEKLLKNCSVYRELWRAGEEGNEGDADEEKWERGGIETAGRIYLGL